MMEKETDKDQDKGPANDWADKRIMTTENFEAKGLKENERRTEKKEK